MSPDIGEIREPLLVRSISRKAVDGNCEAAGVLESVPSTRDEQVVEQGHRPGECCTMEADLAALRLELNYMKGLYFLSNLGTACWGRFAQVYYLQKGLGPARIGLIEAVTPLVQCVTQPCWGYLADALRNRKLVYLWTKTANSAVLMLFAVPSLARGWAALLAISIALSCFSAPGVVDAHVLALCTRLKSNVYGQVRLYGAASWGVGAFAMGVINDFYGFEYNFILYGSLSAAAILLAWWKITNPAPLAQQASGTDGEKDSEGSSIQHLLTVLLQWRSIAFFTEMLVVGMGVGVVERLLFIYLMTDLGGSAMLCGTVVLVTVAFEIPIFHHAHTILIHLGHAGCLSIAYLCYFVRVWGYTLLTPETRHWILALEVLHGFTFALLYSAAVEYARLLAPPEWSSLVQSVLNVTYYNLGNGLGALLGGYIMQNYGARTMYRGFSAMICVLFIFRITAITVKACCQRVNGEGSSRCRSIRTSHHTLPQQVRVEQVHVDDDPAFTGQ